MRLLVCCFIIVLVAGCALAQPRVPTLAGVAPSLRLSLATDPQAPLAPFQPMSRSGSEVFLSFDFSGARDSSVRAAAAPGLAGLAVGRLFESQGAEWQRHYDLGAVTAELAYVIDDRAGVERCWRAFAAGVLVGAAKEISDGYFDRRDFEATACGAAITALLQGVMPRWEW